MAKRFLFCTGEGIGNVVQTIPTIRTMVEVLGYRIDFWHAFGSYKIPKIIPYVDEWFNGRAVAGLDRKRYTGKVSTIWAEGSLEEMPVQMLNLYNTIVPLNKTRSEVDTYMDIARDLGAKESEILWSGECLYTPSKFRYDVVIHDGYNKMVSETRWKNKSYPYYKEVVALLKKKGLTVCCVGTGMEYIKGADGRTDLPLLDTLGIIKNAKLLISNDSGLYHCANALEIPNIVIFTYTSKTKNYDSRFHKYSTVLMRDDLKCIECQNTSRYNKCKTYECREIDPEQVVDIAMAILKGKVKPVKVPKKEVIESEEVRLVKKTFCQKIFGGLKEKYYEIFNA